jgi:hypothetical protein
MLHRDRGAADGSGDRGGELNKEISIMPSMIRCAVVVALALVVAGCVVPESRQDAAEAKVRAAYAQCEQQRLSGRYKTHLAAVDCAVPTVIADYQEAAYPFNDIIYLSIQARRIGARRVDAGDVTEAEYLHDVAELDSRLAAENTRRVDITKYGGDPKPTPPDQLMQGLNAFAPTPSAAALPPPSQTGCVPLGEIRTCK